MSSVGVFAALTEEHAPRSVARTLGGYGQGESPGHRGGGETRVSFAGIGRSLPDTESLGSLTACGLQACQNALTDAGLSIADIDGVCAYPGGSVQRGRRVLPRVEELLGVEAAWRGVLRGAPGPTGNVVDAVLAVASGQCRNVLCFTVFAGRRHSPSSSLARWTGLACPSRGYASSLEAVALDASRYLMRHRRGREALGWVAVAARRHAARNPDALCRSPLPIADYLAADTVAAPLTSLDCDVVRSGAVAVVVSAHEPGLHGENPVVLVDAVGTPTLAKGIWAGAPHSYRTAPSSDLRGVWDCASVLREDVDFVAVDDTYTFNALSWLEALSFCAPGEAAGFVEGGARIGPDGVLPVNPDGGQLANGHQNGYGNLYETVLQLRGRADTRQIPSVRVAAIASGTPRCGSVMVLHVEN